MDKIKDLKQGAGIELEFEITSIQNIRKLWKCFSCQGKGRWMNEEEFREDCPQCGEGASDVKGKGLWIQDVTSCLVRDDSGTTYLDLWNEDIAKYRVGDTLHLINGFARENTTGGVNISKGKYGSLEKKGE